MFPNQLSTKIKGVITKLQKGGITKPFKTLSGWNIVKVDDKRPFKIPSLAEEQNQVRQQLIQQQRIELINKLRGETNISKQ